MKSNNQKKITLEFFLTQKWSDPCSFRHGDRLDSTGCSLRGSERFVDTKASQSRNSTLLYPQVTYLYILVLYNSLYGKNWGFPSGLCTDSKTTKKKVKLYFMRKRKISHSLRHISLSTANIRININCMCGMKQWRIQEGLLSPVRGQPTVWLLFFSENWKLHETKEILTGGGREDLPTTLKSASEGFHVFVAYSPQWTKYT